MRVAATRQRGCAAVCWSWLAVLGINRAAVRTRRATWSECVVMSMRSGVEVPVPRMFLGEITRIEEPVMVVRLSRELTWKDGAVVPRHALVYASA